MPNYELGPAVGVQAVVAVANTPVAAAPYTFNLAGSTEQDFPDNCHTVIIYNTDTANTLEVGVHLGQVGFNPTAGPMINPILVPPLGTISLAIGTLSQRISQLQRLAPAPILLSGFVYNCVAAPLTANVTYVCGIIEAPHPLP